MKALLLLLTSLLAGTAHADPVWRQPTPTGGEVIATDEFGKKVLYDSWHFAPVRVEGDWVFISGVVAGARDAKAVLDEAGFEAALERAFAQIDLMLKAAGSDGGHVVDLFTFHVFASPAFSGGKDAHFTIFRRVKDRFIRAPYPSWTAIGVSDLVPAAGLAEIRVVARKRR